MYTSLNKNGTYTEQELKSDVVSNREVTLNATNLTQYTDYYWYVTASDGTTTARSEKKELEPIVQAQELIYVMNQLWPTAQLAQEQEN